MCWCCCLYSCGYQSRVMACVIVVFSSCLFNVASFGARSCNARSFVSVAFVVVVLCMGVVVLVSSCCCSSFVSLFCFCVTALAVVNCIPAGAAFLFVCSSSFFTFLFV